ncbi:histidine kinase [Streptomyces sp. V4-01]|uniref:histidine kinase n=1 Tax=Actinacidiphila polyblastidii TaxID=3110430 RepID=A0ABU7PGG1_9ACTN|nr:histidine kinase [Streptomyces sp. V4-01]
MTWSNPPGGPWASRVRRCAAAPDLPLVAAATLATAGLLQSAVSVGRHSFADGSTPTATALLLSLGATVPVAFARTQLTAVAAAVTAAVLLGPLSGVLPTAAGLVALAVLIHLVGLRSRPWVAVLFAAPFVVDAVGATAGLPGGKPLGVALLALAAAALSLGVARRAHAEAAARTEAGWAYADTLLQHAVRGERARIARELHDIVAHHISSLSVQAETARLTTPGLPPEGADRLLAIGATARQALTEMRRLLGVLREDAAPAAAPGPAAAGTAPPAADRSPQPGLDQLLALVDQAREASGAVVRLTVSGRVRPLGPGVELAAYRIVQEALTNARRHAPGAPVDVELGYGEEALRVAVRDSSGGAAAGTYAGGARTAGVRAADVRTAGARTGVAAARGGMGDGHGHGHGLLGMRERAAMAGGTLRAGPGPATGFLVEARLPASAGVV